jgi:hypothetical protein
MHTCSSLEWRFCRAFFRYRLPAVNGIPDPSTDPRRSGESGSAAWCCSVSEDMAVVASVTSGPQKAFC